MDINFDDLTIGEVEEIEEISGVSFSQISTGDLPVKVIKAMVFITKRREDPNFTLEDAGKVKLADFSVSAETDPPVPPA